MEGHIIFSLANSYTTFQKEACVFAESLCLTQTEKGTGYMEDMGKAGWISYMSVGLQRISSVNLAA